MKKILLYIIVLVSWCFSEAQNPIRTVLYICEANEGFHFLQSYSNIQVSGNKFACVTKNKISKNLSFILNGKKIITAKDLEIHWVDLNTELNCIYKYTKNDSEEYLVIEGKKYGPFEEVQYSIIENYYFGIPNLLYLYNRNHFYFRRMGKIYRHDNDGSIYELKETASGMANETDPIYKSADGLHQAQFTNNYRLLTVDNKSYILPIDVDVKDENIYFDDIFVSNDGVCFFAVGFFIGDGSDMGVFRCAVDSNSIQYISEREYFDPITKTILPKGSGWNFRNHIKCKDGTWVNEIDVSLQDKTKRHVFIANWEYDYVMVDDKKFGKCAPINAFYDETNNTFVWVTIEGKQLVEYVYKL